MELLRKNRAYLLHALRRFHHLKAQEFGIPELSLDTEAQRGARLRLDARNAIDVSHQDLNRDTVARGRLIVN